MKVGQAFQPDSGVGQAFQPDSGDVRLESLTYHGVRLESLTYEDSIMNLPAILIAALTCGLLAETPPPYQSDFPPEEFRARWNTVFDRIGDRGVAIVVGAPSTTGFLVPRRRTSSITSAGSKHLTPI